MTTLSFIQIDDLEKRTTECTIETPREEIKELYKEISEWTVSKSTLVRKKEIQSFLLRLLEIKNDERNTKTLKYTLAVAILSAFISVLGAIISVVGVITA